MTQEEEGEALNADVESVLSWKYLTRQPVNVDDGLDSPQEVYRVLLNEAFAPALRKAGLRGSAGRFNLPSPTKWALLGFQKLAYSDQAKVRFTVSVFVVERWEWAELLEKEPWYPKQPSPLAEQFVGIRRRIGSLFPAKVDKWWILRRGQDPQDVCDDVLRDLIGTAVPWLKQMAEAGEPGRKG